MANIPRPGNSFPSFQRSPPNSMRIAINVAKNKNAILNTGAGAKDAVTEPITTPMIAGNAQMRTTSGITAPFFLCPR